MKFSPSIRTRSHCTLVSAFTLVEIMMAMVVFVVFIVAGMVAVQLFGLRMNNFTTDKLLAAGGCSKAMDQIGNQIRGAQFFWVGTFSTNGGGAFTPVANGSSQQGTALQVFPTTSPTPYTIYYLNPVATKLYSVTDVQIAAANVTGTLLASGITNTPCFWSENFHGTVNTTTNPFAAGENCTIRIVWNFYQYATSDTNIGHEFYTFQTRATPRAPNF
jgi:type II secretory pathway pseudopilin PulG